MESVTINQTADGVIEGVIVTGANNDIDFFLHEPTKAEKMEMRKTTKRVSEWLNLLCRDWTTENSRIVDDVDMKFLAYKPFLKGQLSSQLLCRLAIPDHHPRPPISLLPPSREVNASGDNNENGTSNSSTIYNDSGNTLDFWNILGIHDEFDKSYIISQIERFCALYSIRGILFEEVVSVNHSSSPSSSFPALTTASDGEGLIANQNYLLDSQIEPCDVSTPPPNSSTSSPNEAIEPTPLHNRQLTKLEQRQIMAERRETRIRERESANIQKSAEKAAKEATREERRQKKLMLRQQRERFVLEQKNAALQRAAELVQSNRVPIAITRGAAAAQAAANAAVAMMGTPTATTYQNEEYDSLVKKNRSAIVISTASDLDQIVTHARNLFAKYNAIAKEHNQKVNWATVAKELGIHVKVREKYARMHSRACQRGFDFSKYGHYKIKENPQIFLVPLTDDEKMKYHQSQQQQQEQIQQCTQDPNTDDMDLGIVVHETNNKEVSHAVSSISDDQVAAAVDAAIKTVPVSHGVTGFHDAAAASAVDAAMTIDTDGHPHSHHHSHSHGVEQNVGLSVEDAAAAALAAHDSIDAAITSI